MVDTLEMTADIASTTATTTVGDAGTLGGIDDVRIGHTDTTTPTYVLDLEFEPYQVSSTQFGNASNTWSWQGQVTNQAATGNNGTYFTTADLSFISTTVAALLLAQTAPAPPFQQATANLVPEASLDIFLTPQATITSPFLDPIRQAANAGFMTPAAWWWLLATLVAALASSHLFTKVPSFAYAAVLGGVIYWAAGMVSGVTFFPLLGIWGVWCFGVIAIHQYMSSRS